MRYHGPRSPGGVAHAVKVLELALPLLDPEGPCERREIAVETAFGGPGARDAFELVTRAVTGHRYRVESARVSRARPNARAVRISAELPGRAVTLVLREGFVTDEFIDLARTQERTEPQERRLDQLKREMAERVLARPAAEVYEIGDATIPVAFGIVGVGAIAEAIVTGLCEGRDAATAIHLTPARRRASEPASRSLPSGPRRREQPGRRRASGGVLVCVRPQDARAALGDLTVPAGAGGDQCHRRHLGQSLSDPGGPGARTSCGRSRCPPSPDGRA